VTYQVSFDESVLGPWVYENTCGGDWTLGRAIGLYKDGEIVAGAAFEGYNGYNITVHICIKQPQAAMLLFKLIARYVFGQLQLRRLTLWAEETNIAAVELHKRLGAVLEGRLVGAGSGGNDILISRLTPSCKLWRRWNGQVSQHTSDTELRGDHSASGTVEHQPVQRDVGSATLQ
jgi:hypothetical protein